RRLDAIGPGPAIFGACSGERGAGNLLGVKTERWPLRRVATDRQRTGHRFRQEVIAEARLIGGRRGGALGAGRFGLGVGLFSLFNGWGHGGPPGGVRQTCPSGRRVGDLKLVSNATNILLSACTRKFF